MTPAKQRLSRPVPRTAFYGVLAILAALAITIAAPLPARAEIPSFSETEMVRTGHETFGKASSELASVVEYVFKKKGRPTAYIVGQQASAALGVGLNYGEGWLRQKSGGQTKVYWQGPSVGVDVGGDGARVLVLVYKLQEPQQLFDRFGGVDGSAYVVGGVGVTFRTNNKVNLAIIRTGLGLRLGVNAGYLKYTRKPTWNPF